MGWCIARDYLLQAVLLKCAKFKSVVNRGPEAHQEPCCLGPGKSKELAHASICTPDPKDLKQATQSPAHFPYAISLPALVSRWELLSVWHQAHVQWRLIRKRILEELFMSFAVCGSSLAVRVSQCLHTASRRNAFMQNHDNSYFSLNLLSLTVRWATQSALFEHPFLLSLLLDGISMPERTHSCREPLWS